MYTLKREQLVTTTLERAWNFLKNPVNLNIITPENLHFRIISPVPDIMYNGLIIEYKVTIPIFGTRTWVAEIKHIQENRSFVDEQRIGPYTLWYHYHELVESKQGVRVIDRVYYEVPYGLAGRLLHKLFIQKTLEDIFNYRKEKLQKMLGE